jgi:hypothetical protein
VALNMVLEWNVEKGNIEDGCLLGCCTV